MDEFSGLFGEFDKSSESVGTCCFCGDGNVGCCVGWNCTVVCGMVKVSFGISALAFFASSFLILS